MSKKYNILCLTQDFFIGGAEIMLYRLLRHINKKQFNCIICCYKKSGSVIELIKKTGSTIVLLKEKQDIGRQLKEIKKKYKINLVYVTTYKLLREAALLKNSHCKIIYHMHNLLRHTHKNLPQDKKDMLLKTIFCLSDKIIACSRAVKKQFDFLRSEGIIDIIYCAAEIDTPRHHIGTRGKLKKEYKIPFDTKIVAMLGRVEPQKEPELFIKICKRVKKKFSNVKFFIIGLCASPKFLKLIKNDIKTSSLTDSILLTGFRNDIHEIINDIDVVVSTSAYESFGLSALEGMAAGKAVIATNTGGVAEIIKNRKTGILVKPYGITSFADPMLNLLQNDTWRKRLGQKAQKEVTKKYSAGLYTKNMENAFLGVVPYGNV
jgi:glycosyltransferase involved in cell wall biosynthesis